MTSAVQKKAGKTRTAPKESRKLQLIKATINSVAKRGIADTTLADVSKQAGLSQGIVNLHFQSKQKLFVETLRFLADEYKNAWERTLSKGGITAAEKLSAMVHLDFSRQVCERKKIAVWFAFWGEARSRPTYRQLCAERDREYGEVVKDLCKEIIAEGDYDVDPAMVSDGLSAMTNGLWLDILIAPDQQNREQARRVCYMYLARIFPRHFSLEDLEQEERV